jgi:hypothetical protein
MNAKRGYVPEDERNYSREALETMRIASRHISYLINEGYDILVMNYTDQHVASDSVDYPPLVNLTDVPNLPEYTHRGLADYATFCVYRNGNAVKQNRGMAFYSAFLDIVGKLKYERGGVGRKQFKNIFTR